MSPLSQKMKSRWKKIQLVSASILVLWLGTTWLVLNKISPTSSATNQYHRNLKNEVLSKKQNERNQTQLMRNIFSDEDDSVVIQPHHLSFDEYVDLSSASYLPAALYPVPSNSTILRSCCQMASSPFKAKRIACQGVCHTPQACVEGGMYPFRNEEEKEFLTLREINSANDDIFAFKSKCNERNSLLEPPFTWCRQWMSGKVKSDNMELAQMDTKNDVQLNHTLLHPYNHRNIDPYKALLPPPGCSILSGGGGSGSYQNLILFPSAKLAFCGIFKAGSTNWIQFLRFTLGARDYQSNPHSKPELNYFLFDKLTEERQMQILNDPEWKFAAFLRDPAERLLSAYLDKVNPKNDAIYRQHFQESYNFSRPPSFEEFVFTIAKKRTVCPFTKTKPTMRERLWGVDWCTDPHWRPQTFSCGLSEFLPRFSYIGSLDKIEHQSRSLLKEVGLWDTYGKYYHWESNKQSVKGSPCWVFPPPLNVGDKLYGFQQKPKKPESGSNLLLSFASNDSTNNTVRRVQKQQHSNGNLGAADAAYGHAKGSQTKIKQYYTPHLLQMARDLYSNDYKLWDLIKNSEDLENGIELTVKVSDHCRERAYDLTNSPSMVQSTTIAD